MAKILVCMSDPQLFLLLRYIMAAEGLEACCVTEEEELHSLAADHEFSAILIDLVQPVADIHAFVAAARLMFASVPVMIMTKADAEDTPACDLLLQSPFNATQLLSFLRWLKSGRRPDDAQMTLRYGDLEMNLASVRVTRAGQPVCLTALEFRLLYCLLQEPTRIHGRQTLIAACWPQDAEVELRTVDIHIGNIRRALARKGPDMIRTVRGRGYGMEWITPSGRDPR